MWKHGSDLFHPCSSPSFAQVTQEAASAIQSEEQKALGHRPESGSVAALAQSTADKNENDGGERTFDDAGI